MCFFNISLAWHASLSFTTAQLNTHLNCVDYFEIYTSLSFNDSILGRHEMMPLPDGYKTVVTDGGVQSEHGLASKK